MIDSARRSDLFRRYGVNAPLRCALASVADKVFPISVILLLSQGLSVQPVTRASAG
jgi:hypothetical protein